MKPFIFTLLLLLTNLCFATTKIQPQSMVVSTSPYATAIGEKILTQGGNAIDAAVAVGYALAVAEPCCGNLGGGGFMLIHLANGKNSFIDFRETAPARIKLALFYKNHKLDPKKIRSGYLSTGVPGTVMGLNYALKHYGTFPLKKIIQPAINLATNGYRLSAGDIRIFHSGTKKFKQTKNVAAIFLKHEQPYQVGDVLKQPQLAHTLESIKNTGNKAFYHGWIAHAIVNASNKHGGVLSLKDFAHYKVYERKPIICYYQGYKVITAPPPSSGGITLCEMLNVLSGYPLKKLGNNSALSYHYMIEAMRYAYADRNQYLGDPAFVSIPTQRLLSQAHAKWIRSQIIKAKAGNSSKIGFISGKSHERMQTTSFAVVDKFGNAVEVTYTINGYFGTGLIAGNTGFFLNNEMDDFTLKPGIPNSFGLIQGSTNAIAPGKRPLSSMTPTILTRHGKIFLVTGAAGGSTIITQVLRTIVNIIDFGMNVKQAIDAPRFHMQWLPDKVFMEPLAFSKKVQTALENMGYVLQLGSPYGTTYWGASVAILNQNGWLTGAVDYRRKVGMAQRF